MRHLANKTRFISVGAQRCGTTSLFFYLRQHPNVFLSDPKETNFFALLADDMPAAMWRHRVLADKPQTLEHYDRLFDAATAFAAVGEVTPLYLLHPHAAETIRQHIPDAKIVICLRDPIERAYSAFQFERDRQRETESNFLHAVTKQEAVWKSVQQWWQFLDECGVSTPYLSGSLYFNQVRRYLDRFPADQVFIYLFDDFQHNPAKIVSSIFDFLSLEPIALDVSETHNDRSADARSRGYTLLGTLSKSAPLVRRLTPVPIRRWFRDAVLGIAQVRSRQTLTKKERAWLRDHVREDVIKLQGLIGRDLTHWLVEP